MSEHASGDAAESPVPFTVPADAAPDRADKLLAATHGAAVSRSRWQTLLDEGRVTCEGATLNRKSELRPGDTLLITLPAPPPAEVRPVAIPLDTLFEDEHIVVVNKRAGMVTHPGAGTEEDTLVHALLHHTRGALAPAGGVLRPGIVHRLDKETSGVIVAAKTDAAYLELVKGFSEREPDKRYFAIVHGLPELLSGVCRAPVERHPANRVKMAVRDDGKPARTDWAVENRFGSRAALVRCKIHTGRTHQIRVHLSHLGFPILGDHTYGRFPDPVLRDWPAPRVMLHAASLSLPHPITREPLRFDAPLPQDFQNLLDFLKTTFGASPVIKITTP